MNFEKFEFYQNLKQLPFVQQIILYGSRARGDFKERADIDLAIFCPKATLSDWNQIISILENADTLLKIDCVRLDQLSNENPLRQSIIREGKVLFQRQNINE